MKLAELARGRNVMQCIRCGKNPALEHNILCGKCRREVQREEKLHSERKAYNSICPNCGGLPHYGAC